jgi:hypothetical protein
MYTCSRDAVADDDVVFTAHGPFRVVASIVGAFDNHPLASIVDVYFESINPGPYGTHMHLYR